MPRAPMFQDVQIQRMKEMYELGGASLAKIAVEFGVSVPTIAKYLRRVGVEVKGRGRPKKKDLTPATGVGTEDSVETPLTPEDVEDARDQGYDGPSPIFKF